MIHSSFHLHWYTSEILHSQFCETQGIILLFVSWLFAVKYYSWKGILTTISKDENHAAISIITNYLTACFPRSRLTTDSFVKFLMCSDERACWLGSRDLVFQPGWKILPYEHLSLVNGMKASWILHNSAFVDSIVLLCLLYFSHCKHPI